MEEKILKVKNLMTNLRNWNDWDVKHYPLSQDEAEVVVDVCLKMVPMRLARLEADPKVWPKGYYDVCPNEECKEAVKNFCICNAFKYLYRCNRKNGLEDIKRAKWYLDRYIKLSEGEDK